MPIGLLPFTMMYPDTPADAIPSAEPASLTVLVHLSGPRRGGIESLVGDRFRIGTADEADIHFAVKRGGVVRPWHAELVRQGTTFVLRPLSASRVSVSGEPIEERVLAAGDLIEIGRGGPRLRFRVLEPQTTGYPSLGDLVEDCIDCARDAAPSRLGRFAYLARRVPVAMATHSPRRVRALGALVLLLLVTTGFLGVRSARLSERLREERSRIDRLTEQVDRNANRSLTVSDLSRIRNDFATGLNSTIDRIEAVETHLRASQEVIATSGGAVALLQGSYGYVDRETGKALLLDVDETGQLITGPSGGPLLSLEGHGPRYQSQYTGTGFLVDDTGLIVTNRHVARPWEEDPLTEFFAAQGFEPELVRFLGYLPDQEQPFPIEVAAVSEHADVAVLQARLAQPPSSVLLPAANGPVLGDAVIVIGYPTGIRALLARSDMDFVDKLINDDEADPWSIAERLAAEGKILPLATRGIVGQATPANVVYDAETTGGGSGGPVLDLEGRVVAVNAAVLPEFGGSNLGVPIAHVLPLLEQARARNNVTPANNETRLADEPTNPLPTAPIERLAAEPDIAAPEPLETIETVPAQPPE